MTEFKYVMLKDNESGQQYPILFPKELVHKYVYEVLAHMMARHHDKFCIVPTAGFCHLDVTKTFGESESLGKKSSPDDAKIINGWNFTNGL